MPRPESYDDSPPARCCAKCMHSRLVAYKLDLLCFRGDNIKITGTCEYPVDADHVELNGEDVELLEGDEYDRVWAARIVDGQGVCDQFEAMPVTKGGE